MAVRLINLVFAGRSITLKTKNKHNLKKNAVVFFVLLSVCTFGQNAQIPPNVAIPLCAGTMQTQTPENAKSADEAKDHEVRDFFAFSICYREHYEQAEWAAYSLTWRTLENPVKRTNDFRADFAISTGSAALDDYKYSGFDRGHLAPAADMVFDAHAMSESFFLSNMSPQNASFNRGIWAKLESQTRAWAKKFGTVWVITGPILEKETYKTIGQNAVAVPEYFYKIVAAVVNQQWQAIGFIIPNAGQTNSFFTFAVPIRDIEKRTNINFLHTLPDEIQDSIEKTVELTLWQ